MVRNISLKKSSFESGKVSVKRGCLFSEDFFKSLENASFEEVLKLLEENGFREEIDSSYLNYEGFYLVEVILNKYLSNIYADILSSSNNSNKKFFEDYYLKYQIHNMLSVIKCKLAGEEELGAFLIGDRRRKDKYLKAFKMPIEDSIVYMSKKLGFDPNQVLEFYNKGIFDLENFLYKRYYEGLMNKKFTYNGRDELVFVQFLKDYVDLLNIRAFSKILVEDLDKKSFRDLFIRGGRIGLDFFENFSGESEDFLKLISKKLKKNLNSFMDVDVLVSDLKRSTSMKLASVSFGSPFYVFKYFLDLEYEISSLRKVLKAKFLGVSIEEIL